MRYVKVCPKCGHGNDESSDICENENPACGFFLGNVPATASQGAPEPVGGADNSTSATTVVVRRRTKRGGDISASAQSAAVAVPVTGSPGEVTQRIPDEVRVFYLDLPEHGKCYPAQNGWILGQAHPSNDAQIQVSGIPGSVYLHRRHCQFLYEGGQWHVTAIRQSDKPDAFTNPTLLNNVRIAPGEKHPLHNGDLLSLSNVTFHVRVIEP